MSARTPFFPSGASTRPSAHTTSSESTANGHGGNPVGSNFRPDLSNPLHAFSGSGQTMTASGKANGAGINMMGMGDASAVSDVGNVNGNPPPVPQLNLSGLKKKKGPLATPSNNSSGFGVGTTGGGGFSANANNAAATGMDGFGISRPATADPHRKANVAGHGHGAAGIRPRASLGSNLDPVSGISAANGRQGGGGGGTSNPFGSKSTTKLLAPAPITAASPPTSLFNTNGANHVGGTFSSSNLDSSGSVPSFSGFKTPGGALTGQNGADMRQDRDWAGLALERPHTSMRSDQERNISEAVQQSNQQQQAFRAPAFNLGVARTPDTSTETLVNQDDDSFDHSRGSKPGLDGSHNGFGQFLPAMDSGMVGAAAGGGGGGGPRRVILEKGHLNHQNRGDQYADRGQQDLLLPGHAINEQGRVFQQAPVSGRQAPVGRKRAREQVDLEQDGMRYDMPDANRMKMAKLVDEGQGIGHHAQEEYDVSMQPRPIQKIMKMDLDEFFANHLDVYDQAVAHWNGCSLKEWFDGSEELTSKFTECLDSAKEYMLKDLKTHTNLHTVLDDHKANLHAQERALKAAMGMALEESQHVLR